MRVRCQFSCGACSLRLNTVGLKSPCRNNDSAEPFPRKGELLSVRVEPTVMKAPMLRVKEGPVSAGTVQGMLFLTRSDRTFSEGPASRSRWVILPRWLHPRWRGLAFSQIEGRERVRVTRDLPGGATSSSGRWRLIEKTLASAKRQPLIHPDFRAPSFPRELKKAWPGFRRLQG